MQAHQTGPHSWINSAKHRAKLGPIIRRGTHAHPQIHATREYVCAIIVKVLQTHNISSHWGSSIAFIIICEYKHFHTFNNLLDFSNSCLVSSKAFCAKMSGVYPIGIFAAFLLNNSFAEMSFFGFISLIPRWSAYMLPDAHASCMWGWVHRPGYCGYSCCCSVKAIRLNVPTEHHHLQWMRGREMATFDIVVMHVNGGIF